MTNFHKIATLFVRTKTGMDNYTFNINPILTYSTNNTACNSKVKTIQSSKVKYLTTCIDQK